MRINGNKVEIHYNDFRESDKEFDRDKYIAALRNCETFEDFINILTKDDYNDLAQAGDMNYLEYPEHY